MRSASVQSSTPSAKEDNHEITKGYLKNWLSASSSGAEGIWYFDITLNKVSFSRGKKARFAITPWLYVPELNSGGRDDRLENWFADYETQLCELARFASNGPPRRRLTSKFQERAIKGCITLGHRSSYEISRLSENFRKRNPEWSENEVRIGVLENLYTLLNSQFEQFSEWLFVVNYNLPLTLISSERPFVNFDLRVPSTPIVSMALGPRCMLTGMPNKNGSSGFKLNWFDASSKVEICKLYNKFQIEMARQWVVCSNKEEVEAISHDLTPDKVASRRQLDTERYRLGSFRALYP